MLSPTLTTGGNWSFFMTASLVLGPRGKQVLKAEITYQTERNSQTTSIIYNNSVQHKYKDRERREHVNPTPPAAPLTDTTMRSHRPLPPPPFRIPPRLLHTALHPSLFRRSTLAIIYSNGRPLAPRRQWEVQKGVTAHESSAWDKG